MGWRVSLPPGGRMPGSAACCWAFLACVAFPLPPWQTHSTTPCPPPSAPSLPPTTGYELLRFMSLVHVLGPPPDALLVDDLHTLADLPAAPDRHRPRDMALCRILAAMHEAVVSGAEGAGGGMHSSHAFECSTGMDNSASCMLEQEVTAPACPVPLPPPCQDVAAQLNGRPCHLIATELASADGPRQPFILQRWLPLLLHIRRAQGRRWAGLGSMPGQLRTHPTQARLPALLRSPGRRQRAGTAEAQA